MTSAIVLAGGLGTRMAPLTATRPKHLLEVAGEPFLAHQMRWLARNGVTDVVLATAHLAEAFAPVLGDGGAFGVRLAYAVEPHPLGTGGALVVAGRLLPDAAPDAPIVVVNGDLFTEHDVRAQVRCLDRAAATDVVLHLRTVADATAYGSVVADADGRVTAFVEKSPDPPSLEVNCGTYAVRRRVIDGIRPGVVSLERDILPGLVTAGRITAYREQAVWVDVGSPAALVGLSAAIVVGRGLAAWIDPAAEVDPAAVVGGGASVGAGARVAAYAQVLGSVLMPGAVVGAGASVCDSVLGRGARVMPGAILDGGVLGDGEAWPTAE